MYLSLARPVVSEPKGLTLLLLLLVGWWEIRARDMDTKKRCFKQQAKHTADADSPAPAARLWQTTLESLPGRRLDTASTSSNLSTAIAKWVAMATACRTINIVEDEGLCEIIRIASNVSTAHHSALF